MAIVAVKREDSAKATRLLFQYLRRDSIARSGKNVKFSHTRYRALGPELIPLYRQSAHRWLEAIHPAVGCHYFPPCRRLPSQPKSVTAHRPVLNYTAWWQRHMRVSSLPKDHLEADRPRFEPATFRVASERSTVKPNRYMCVIACLVRFLSLACLPACVAF